jgi:hypothetical protein
MRRGKRGSGPVDPERSAALRGNKNASKRGSKSSQVTTIKMKGTPTLNKGDFAKGFAYTAVGGPIGAGISTYRISKRNRNQVLGGESKAVGKIASRQLGGLLGSTVQGAGIGLAVAKSGLIAANPAVGLGTAALAGGLWGAGIGIASNKGIAKGLGKKNVRFIN